MQYNPTDANSQPFYGISSPLTSPRAFGHPVLRPEDPTQVGTERTAADQYHLADDIEVVDGLEGYLLAAHPVAAHCQGCTPPCCAVCRGPLPPRPGSGPAWSWSGRSGCPGIRGCRDDAVGPFQAVVELGHVVFVDAAAALPDAVVAMDAEVEVFATC